MRPRLTILAALLPTLFVSTAHAQQLAMLDPVVVTATRQPTRVSELLSDITVIDREEIERNGQGTITELLSRQPGVQVSSNGGPGTTTSFYVRGARPEQTKVLVDGVPINSVDLSGSPLRFLPLGDVEGIEILRGPAATLYGADAVGGVIQVFTRRGSPGLKADGFVGYGTQNTRQATAGLSGGDERWRFRVEANHQASDSISAQKRATNRDADKDPYENNGGGASLSFIPLQGHEIGASYRRNDGIVHYDSGNTPANGTFDNRVEFTTEQWQVYSKNRLMQNWDSKLYYGEAEDFQKNYYSFAPNGDYLRTRSRQLGWQNDVKLPLGIGLIAVERLEQSVTPVSSFVQKPEISINSILAAWNASYGMHRWQISGRHDKHTQFGSQDTYSVAYGMQFTPAWRAHASYGTAFKAPSLYQLYDQFSGNSLLKPEQARNREIALIWDGGKHSASATYYLNRVENLIDFSFATFTYQNVSQARLEGVTLSYNGRFDRWTVTSAIDFLDATNADTHQRLGRRAKEKLTLSATRHFGNFDFGGEVIAVGKRYNTNDQTGQMGAYALANVFVRYGLTKDWSLEGRINNLFDQKYEHAVGYNTLGFNAFVGLRYQPK